MKNSALDLLQNDELCTIIMNGREREAAWRKVTRMFIFTDGDEPAYARPDQIEEWMPATKF